jgi:DNA helicase-2/ATP-dependent DNA helicase PcrA
MDERQWLLTGLNEEQCQAVTAPDGPTVVFAGPGSGKTTVLTRRVLYLLQSGVSPSALMVVTFTRAAAREMKERLMQVMPDLSGRLAIGTFHSLFLQLLRERRERIPRILSAGEQTVLIRQLLAGLGQPTDEETVSTMLNQIGLCKGHLIFPQQLNVQKQKNVMFRGLYAAYEEEKEHRDAWDYDDILLAVHRLCDSHEVLGEWQDRFRHVLVDEFQDVNRVQYEILRRLTKVHRNLFAVGDDDQAIYGFRGSDPRLMLELGRDFPELRRIVLSVNYRSTDEIIAASERLIRHNRMRQPKTRVGRGIRGPEPEWMEPEDEEREAEAILSRLEDRMETAVLYRTSTQARALIDALVRKGIPFAAFGQDQPFYRRWQVQDVLSYLRLAYDPFDLDALARIINKPKRYIFGEEWMEACWALARRTGRTPLDVLPELPGLESYQVRHLHDLKEKIARLHTVDARGAVRLVRSELGYNRYLETFAEELGEERDSVFEAVEELELAASHCANARDLIRHADQVLEKLAHPSPEARVKLMTLHRAKGLEFDRVFLIGLHAMVLPHHRALQVPEHRRNAAWEEERRLLYVGMTRARTELILSVSKMRQGKRVGPSPFLREIGFDVGETKALIAATNEVQLPVQAPSGKRLVEMGSRPRLRKSQPRAPEQPQLRFAAEMVQPGLKVKHNKFGAGTVIQVETLAGAVPGRKVLIRFADQVISLHYELARQLQLLEREE